MRYKELSNFTYEELHHFTYEELSLDKYELIAKAENGSIVLPENIQAELRSLCTELAKQCPEKKNLLEGISLRTVNDALTAIKTGLGILQTVTDPVFSEQIKKFICHILEFLSTL